MTHSTHGHAARNGDAVVGAACGFASVGLLGGAVASPEVVSLSGAGMRGSRRPGTGRLEPILRRVGFRNPHNRGSDGGRASYTQVPARIARAAANFTRASRSPMRATPIIIHGQAIPR